MFEKGYSRAIASESLFIGKQILVMNEEVNGPALLKGVQKLAGKPSHSHSYQLLARTVLEQWHSLVGATMATRRYHPANTTIDGRPLFGRVARPTAPEAPSQ
jgi:hypothetical protein